MGSENNWIPSLPCKVGYHAGFECHQCSCPFGHPWSIVLIMGINQPWNFKKDMAQSRRRLHIYVSSSQQHAHSEACMKTYPWLGIYPTQILFISHPRLKTEFSISPHFVQSRHLEPAPRLPCRRSVALMALVMAVHGVWILENPASTLIHESKWFQWLLRATAKYGIKAPQSIFDVFIL